MPQPFAAVTLRLKSNVPNAAGFPDKTPVAEISNPVGNIPELRTTEYGAVPPLGVIVWL